MKIKNLFKAFSGDQRGIALVAAAAAMVVLLGFTTLVTDIGLIVLNRQKLINTMGAAALAGAQDLPDNPAQAIMVARDYSLRNNYESSGPGDPVIMVSPDNTSITVSGKKDVSLALAKVLGIFSKTVTASATAQKQYPTSMVGLVPFTVEKDDVKNANSGDPFIFTYDSNGTMGKGQYGTLAFGGITGDTALYNNIVYTYTGIVDTTYPWNTQKAEPGANVGKIRQAMRERLCGHEDCTFYNHEPDCPKIITMPVYDRSQSDPNGRGDYIIVGFTSFFLDNSCLDHGKFEVTGKFIKTTGAAGSASAIQTDYGVSTVRLTK